ncbi:MAG TPA: GNAT family N-acetyltransferase [Anaeromyxobacteraceae bacterium]|nr:GNAT family N-acetyltransferase [Anaeromyxobacteraceae bacterium]
MPNWEKEADVLHASGARYALILAGASDARTQIAEGIARALAPRQIRIASAGLAPGAVDSLAVRVLAELSVVGSDLRARTLEEVDVDGLGAIVVLSEEDPTPPALHGVLRVHWPLADPARGGGSEEERVARYRAVRNELRRRLIRVFAREALPSETAGGATTSVGPASGGDLDAIRRLLVAALLPSGDLGGPNQRFIVARQGGRVVGCAGLETFGENGQLRSMAVHWTSRNAGLGSTLHGRLLFEALQAGVRNLYVVTTTAEDFFTRQGYRKVRATDVPPGVLASEEYATFVPGGGVVMSRPVAT